MHVCCQCCAENWKAVGAKNHMCGMGHFERNPWPYKENHWSTTSLNQGPQRPPEKETHRGSTEQLRVDGDLERHKK